MFMTILNHKIQLSTLKNNITNISIIILPPGNIVKEDDETINYDVYYISEADFKLLMKLHETQSPYIFIGKDKYKLIYNNNLNKDGEKIFKQLPDGYCEILLERVSE